MYVTEEAILRWLRSLGFREVPSFTASRASVAKLNVPEMRRIWSFLLSRARSAEEAARCRELSVRHGASNAARERLAARRKQAALDASIAELEGQVEACRRRLREQAEEAVEAEAAARAQRSELHAAGLQAAALEALLARQPRLMDMMVSFNDNLRALIAVARQRLPADDGDAGAAAASGRGEEGSSDDARRVEAIARGMQREVEAAAAASLERASSAAPGDAAPAFALAAFAPSAALRQQVDGLYHLPPRAVVRALARLAEGARGELQRHVDALAAGDATAGGLLPGPEAAAAAAEADGGLASPDPARALKHLQREHLRLFVRAEAALRQLAPLRARLAALPLADPATAQLLTRPAHALGAAAAGLRAEVAVLRLARGALAAQLSARRDAQRRLQEEEARIEAAARRLARQDALLAQLLCDSGALPAAWRLQRPGMLAFLTSQLPQRLAGLAREAQAASGCLPAELAAAARLGARAPGLVPAACGLTAAAGRGATAAGAGAPAAGAPTLHRFNQALPPGTARDGARAMEIAADVPAHTASLASVLRAASGVDPTLPLKCPGAFTAELARSQTHLQVLRREVASSQQAAPAPAAPAVPPERAAELARQVASYRDTVATVRLPALRRTAAEVDAAQEQAEGGLRAALASFWNQPALAAVPWVTLDGRGCQDWLAELQLLHAEMRGAGGGDALSAALFG